MKFFKTLLAVGVISSMSLTANAQDESVILYNSQPVKVILAGDQIQSFVGAAKPGYMTGYDLSKSNEIKVIPEVASAGTDVRQNADYSVLSSERILLPYKAGFATLDKKTISELNSISTKLKADGALKILLTAHLDGSDTADKLAKNRLQAAIMYLNIKGVSSDRLQSSSISGASMVDQIAVNYMQ